MRVCLYRCLCMDCVLVCLCVSLKNVNQTKMSEAQMDFKWFLKDHEMKGSSSNVKG